MQLNGVTSNNQQSGTGADLLFYRFKTLLSPFPTKFALISRRNI